MTIFAPLCSGSSGNCTYIGTRTEGILVDAGATAKSILTGLSQIGVEAGAVRAILVTHDHNDHIKGLRVLTKRLRVPVCSTVETLEGILDTKNLEPGAELLELSSQMELGGMEIRPFDTPHDTAHSVGFRIQAGERTIGYATDLGQVTPEIWQGLRGADLVLIESNYEPRLLDISPYPYYLRRRISSNHGHLGNPECSDTVRRLAQEGTGRFVLAHLSRENNTPELAGGAARAALLEAGMEEGRDYLLTVANRLTVTGPILF
ncbi:MAG: MBL fold metallo-hydrolase [Angelakisella sp.]|jgi:phosphoribosyl 1,2-cyclic phosphodiesterase|nr:MBL fold metallo-hydrolase [Angelakisella sp.]